MIERLVHTLQALAAPVDAQLARFPDFAVKADELALDFADALLLVLDCPQLTLEPAQKEALLRVDRQLDKMSGTAKAPLWTTAALRDNPEWRTVRTLAVAALQALGQSVELPPPSGAIFVRGRAP
jgi:hypothetical protein